MNHGPENAHGIAPATAFSDDLHLRLPGNPGFELASTHRNACAVDAHRTCAGAHAAHGDLISVVTIEDRTVRGSVIRIGNCSPKEEGRRDSGPSS